MNPHQAQLAPHNPDITAADWQKPVWFRAEAKTPKPFRHDPESAGHLWGWIPSLYVGEHVGWEVRGQRVPRSGFREEPMPGNWTGAAPVRLTPLIPIP